MKDEKRREQWAAAKRRQRARLKEVPVVPSKEFINRVMRERDARANLTQEYQYIFRHSDFTKDGTWESAVQFVADVWAASTITKKMWGSASPSRMADWLLENGYEGQSDRASLRVMIYRARKRIADLENKELLWKAGSAWPPFEDERLNPTG